MNFRRTFMGSLVPNLLGNTLKPLAPLQTKLWLLQGFAQRSFQRLHDLPEPGSRSISSISSLQHLVQGLVAIVRPILHSAKRLGNGFAHPFPSDALAKYPAISVGQLQEGLAIGIDAAVHLKPPTARLIPYYVNFNKPRHPTAIP